MADKRTATPQTMAAAGDKPSFALARILPLVISSASGKFLLCFVLSLKRCLAALVRQKKKTHARL